MGEVVIIEEIPCENGDGIIAKVTINRPDKLNSLNQHVVSELKDMCSWAEQNDSVRCIIITGASPNPPPEGKRAKPNEAIAAKNFLNAKIKGKKVSIRRVTEDKYGRTVGELSFNGENLQELLVKEGHAEIYKKYSKPCKWAS